MPKKVKVRLLPIVVKVNLPTVLRTAIFPGDSSESLFVATQVGEIFYIKEGRLKIFLDIRSRIIKLGASGGYDERGLLGLAFHPGFSDNGLFYLHYSVAGTQGAGAFSESFSPNPCDPATLNLKWNDRDKQYDHIDTVEEWRWAANGRPQKQRTLLNIRRPFSNHNGVNSLNFSPETGRLILTNGDGGSGFDPFNLSQDNLEIAGKIIEIDVSKNTSGQTPPAVTRFDELPESIQETLTLMAKGVRNIPGISFQRTNNQYIKYAGNVGQDLAETIFAFNSYKPIPVPELVRSGAAEEGLINFGWRAWEGVFPTSIIRNCSTNGDEKTMAYYNEAVKSSAGRLSPLISYFHQDTRPEKFEGKALTGVQAYMGNGIPDLTGSVVFTDLARKEKFQSEARGVLAYGRIGTDDFSIIETDYNFGLEPAYFVSLGTNLDQTILYLGVNGSMKVTDFNRGTVFGVML
ncbi:PQQ-dependent sugar dehydrogenase [Bacillus sp. AGMB 02131]|uniref:PQQ-dependent sugar dehydrogenase n=1 Tax=Peribacillus faecalis TaxID=2772559 RepID=A0A927H9U2_9BACI|nr:PQQ-dependent sugar dehydrogenase [Peribacillus faecalis]MBD3107244.1 PQQ-dependent sugar dehydrogenase [Peribacillus faecalis]